MGKKKNKFNLNKKSKIRTTMDQEQEEDKVNQNNKSKKKKKQQINNKEANLTQSRLHALGSGRKTSSGEEVAVHSQTNLS